MTIDDERSKSGRGAPDGSAGGAGVHPRLIDDLLASHGPDDVVRYIALADHLLARDDRAMAAAALDRAFGLAPDDPGLVRQRATILDELAVTEAGLAWRYVPAGTFVMGSERGDPDERPVHPRRVAAFWITDVPITWTAYCLLMGWSPPSTGWPPESESMDRFRLSMRNKIRLRYCQGEPVAAYDWRAHLLPDGSEPAAPETPGFKRYATKPMVAVAVEDCELLAARLTTAAFRVALPSEAQWEKAARGGLVGARFSWGDQPAGPERCDFDHFGAFHLVDPRTLPANGYGLHGMCGGVWEWTRDGYDALGYRDPASSTAPTSSRVLRGGSWSDCAAACTVSYRMSRAVDSRPPAPNIGFRLVREAV